MYSNGEIAAGCVVILFWLLWVGIVVFVAAHFIAKFW